MDIRRKRYLCDRIIDSLPPDVVFVPHIGIYLLATRKSSVHEDRIEIVLGHDE
jgi:hypothetical protein